MSTLSKFIDNDILCLESQAGNSKKEKLKLCLRRCFHQILLNTAIQNVSAELNHTLK